MLSLLVALAVADTTPRPLCHFEARSRDQQIAMDMVATAQHLRGCLPTPENKYRQELTLTVEGRVYVVRVKVWQR